MNLRVITQRLASLLAAGLTVVAVQAVAQTPDYQRARYDAMHFKPAIDKATNAQCLTCHAEILQPSVRAQSPAGVKAQTAKAWYQQISTYNGAQDTFHRRHLETPMAKELMNMRCSTCHQGNDLRDRNPGSSATAPLQGDFSIRKTVVPEKTCLLCHGQMNFPVMGLPGPWREFKDSFQNNCLLCHAAIRTSRHKVNFLNAAAIETAAAKENGGDVCFGCHGGRAWYRINFPYPRHAWEGMDPAVPDWAKDRPTESDVRFLADVMGQNK